MTHQINTYISGMTYFISKTIHRRAHSLYYYIDIIIRTIYGDAVVIGEMYFRFRVYEENLCFRIRFLRLI